MANKVEPVQVSKRGRAKINRREKADRDVEDADIVGGKGKVDKGARIGFGGIFASGFGGEGKENSEL